MSNVFCLCVLAFSSMPIRLFARTWRNFATWIWAGRRTDTRPSATAAKRWTVSVSGDRATGATTSKVTSFSRGQNFSCNQFRTFNQDANITFPHFTSSIWSVSAKSRPATACVASTKPWVKTRTAWPIWTRIYPTTWSIKCRSSRCLRSGSGARRGATMPRRRRRRPSTCATTRWPRRPNSTLPFGLSASGTTTTKKSKQLWKKSLGTGPSARDTTPPMSCKATNSRHDCSCTYPVTESIKCQVNARLKFERNAGKDAN